jgi:sporulation protein YlmC with PRC-barrel domain
MRIDLDAKVRTRDGRDVGRVARAIVDPDAKELSGFVVSSGVPTEERVVPLDVVQHATLEGDFVVLQLTKDEFERLEPFDAGRYPEPPLGFVPPAGGTAWGFPADAYLIAAALPPSPGVEEPQVEKGTRVVDRDGDDVGVVEDVSIDGTSGRVQRFTVKVGGALETLFGGGEPLELAPEDVAEVADDAIRLARDKDELAPR